MSGVVLVSSAGALNVNLFQYLFGSITTIGIGDGGNEISGKGLPQSVTTVPRLFPGDQVLKTYNSFADQDGCHWHNLGYASTTYDRLTSTSLPHGVTSYFGCWEWSALTRWAV
mgnify:CR=1 FL=1